MAGGVLPTWAITDLDEAALLESIYKHNNLAREYNNSSCEICKAEIMRSIEQLRAERQVIVKKYEEAQ